MKYYDNKMGLTTAQSLTAFNETILTFGKSFKSDITPKILGTGELDADYDYKTFNNTYIHSIRPRRGEI